MLFTTFVSVELLTIAVYKQIYKLLRAQSQYKLWNIMQLIAKSVGHISRRQSKSAVCVYNMNILIVTEDIITHFLYFRGGSSHLVWPLGNVLRDFWPCSKTQRIILSKYAKYAQKIHGNFLYHFPKQEDLNLLLHFVATYCITLVIVDVIFHVYLYPFYGLSFLSA